MKRFAIFPCIGLGDALLSLIVSHNISQAGFIVDTYHPLIFQMQSLFPRLPLYPRPDPKQAAFLFEKYDHLIFFYEKLDWMQEWIGAAKKAEGKKVTILNPIATPYQDYPFWEEGEFQGHLSFGDNLVRFCKNKLGLSKATKENGLFLPPTISPGSFPLRIIIHPTSSRKGKNWSPHKFISLSLALQQEGFFPQLILTKKEREEWEAFPHFSKIASPQFETLTALSYFIAASGGFIGNDSGIGHLASCLGLPTFTICRSALTFQFWRPIWSRSSSIHPPRWIPNLKGIRWRDQKWQWFLSVKKVHREFHRFLSAEK